MSFDARERAGVTVRLVLRDIDATAHDAIEPVALQYRVGASGAFAAMPGGYVADATSGPGEATRVTRVSAGLPAGADGQPLVEVRVITTNAVGQDEWVGIDDIEISAASVNGGDGGGCPPPGDLGATPPPTPTPEPTPTREAPELSGLELVPHTFMPSRRGPAIARRGRAGAALRFRLSRPALVRFEVIQGGAAPDDLAPKRWRNPFASMARGRGARRRAASSRGRLARGRALASGGRFSVQARRGLNRLRFSGRVRGRPLAEGAYVLEAVAADRAGRTSAPMATRFRIGRED
jgi:hypothetical protein